MSATQILILFDTETGTTEKMANLIAEGVSLVKHAAPILKAAPKIGSAQNTPNSLNIKKQDFFNCDGLALGSPAYFGNMSAHLKACIDQTSELWFEHALTNKPACVFTSASSTHGGHESTLLSMTLPLLHHGMLIMGVPYSEPALTNTLTGGSPYGPTHLNNNRVQNALSSDEKQICISTGTRLATLAHAIKTGYLNVV